MLVFLLLACAHERDEAPATLDGMSHALYRDWEDPDALREVLAVLGPWLEGEGRGDAAWDGLLLTNLTADDVATVDMPDGTDLSMHVGVAVAAPSAFTLEQHAPLMVEPDQTWTDPGSFDRYDRTVVEGDGPTFEGGEGLVRTDNDVIKSGAFGVTIPYQLRKDYVWIDADAVISRSWITEPGCSDNGKNCVHQTFGLDVFVRSGEGTMRLFTNWLFVETEADSLIGEDARIGLIAKGNQDILTATEDELAARLGQ